MGDSSDSRQNASWVPILTKNHDMGVWREDDGAEPMTIDPHRHRGRLYRSSCRRCGGVAFAGPGVFWGDSVLYEVCRGNPPSIRWASALLLSFGAVFVFLAFADANYTDRRGFEFAVLAAYLGYCAVVVELFLRQGQRRGDEYAGEAWLGDSLFPFLAPIAAPILPVILWRHRDRQRYPGGLWKTTFCTLLGHRSDPVSVVEQGESSKLERCVCSRCGHPSLLSSSWDFISQVWWGYRLPSSALLSVPELMER